MIMLDLQALQVAIFAASAVVVGSSATAAASTESLKQLLTLFKVKLPAWAAQVISGIISIYLVITTLLSGGMTWQVAVPAAVVAIFMSHFGYNLVKSAHVTVNSVPKVTGNIK